VRIWILGAILLLPCGGANADHPLGLANTAHELYGSCIGEVRNEMYCLGFLRGVADTLKLQDAMGMANPNWTWCFEEESVSNAQILQAFKNWHAKHPELWNDPAPVAVTLALRDAWPCKG
jgi:hypothetical protein